MYLPVMNSCEWLAMLSSTIQARYYRGFHEDEQSAMPEYREISMETMNQPSLAYPAVDIAYRKQRSKIYRTDKLSRYYHVSVLKFVKQLHMNDQ